MNRYGIITAIMLLVSSTFVTYGMAQDNLKTNDFCQQNAHLWDSEGRITLEGHKLLHLQPRDWWFDSENQKWKEWPAQNAQLPLEEHQNLNTDGPDWWYDSEDQEWKEWPNARQESLDCHRKIYLSGPQWWFDAESNEWKRWPK